jgi:hypothetical protein
MAGLDPAIHLALQLLKNAFHSRLSMTLSPVIGKYRQAISMVPSRTPQSGQAAMMLSHLQFG